MNKYAELIEMLENKFQNVSVGFINDEILSVSSLGYIIQDHMEVEEFIIKSKLFKYDTKVLQKFHKISGYTFTHFIKRESK